MVHVCIVNFVFQIFPDSLVAYRGYKDDTANIYNP